jgi:murein L,D-transpeptidase YcbB/YkuD
MRKDSTFETLAFCALILSLCLAGPASAQDDVATIIQVMVDQIREGGSVEVAGEPLASTVVLPDFYERRVFAPAWTDPQQLNALVDALRASTQDGLDPRDYHTAAIAERIGASGDAGAVAELDLLATDAVIRLAYHLRFGKVDFESIDPDWNFERDLESALDEAPGALLQRVVERHELASTLDAMRPSHPFYGALRRALEEYRAIEAAGGWSELPADFTIKPGEHAVAVPRLRQRLAVEGDLVAASGDASDLYDSTTVEGVRRFQERHGLTPDGIVGQRTLRALNVPVAARIAQLRLSLERGRHLLQDLPARFVFVNVPAFQLYLVDGTAQLFRSDVVVGKPFTKTPIFRAELTYAVINPTWTVPPGIIKSEIIPGMRRDPNYLERKGLKRVSGQIVQPPGPKNALGRIKLMCPNPHLVYLHDTPQQSLFEKDARTFSHGCIRVKEVIALAERLLGDPENWSRERIEATIANGRTKNVNFPEPVPVFLTYWTAVVGPGDDRVSFYEDVYDRDGAELKALDGPFRFRADVVRRASSLSNAADGAPSSR